jgi:ketosteroid isomerase-like protein
MYGITAVDAAVVVDLVRRACAALVTGDMDGLKQCFARDAVWPEPGDNIYSGDRVGWPQIRG